MHMLCVVMMVTGTVCWRVIVVLQLFGIGLCYVTENARAQECPCEDPKFCQTIKDTTRKEVTEVRGGKPCLPGFWQVKLKPGYITTEGD